LASALLHSDRPTRARPIVLRLLNERPWLHTWRIRAAGLALMERRVPEAITHLRTIIAWTEGSDETAAREACRTAHQMLGEIAQAMGDETAAKREFDAANGAESPMARPLEAASNERVASQPREPRTE
jgi:hypothetical protein